LLLLLIVLMVYLSKNEKLGPPSSTDTVLIPGPAQSGAKRGALWELLYTGISTFY